MALSTRGIGEEGDVDTPEEDTTKGSQRDRKARNPLGKVFKKRNSEIDWLPDDVVEVPRDESAVARQLARRSRWTIGYIKVCAVVAPILLFGVVLAVTRDQPVPVEDKPAVAADRVRAEATVAVEEWLDSGEAPIRGGKIVQWESTRTLPKAKVDPRNETAEPDPTMQTVRFVVNRPATEDKEAALYTAEVLTASTEAGAVSTVGAPALMPMLPSMGEDLSSVNRWPTLEEAADPDERVEAAITDWAKALTSGSAQTLRAAVDDADPDHAYVAFQGMRLQGTSLGDSAVLEWTDSEEPVPSRIVVSVTLNMTDRSGNCSKCAETASEFDVLIDEVDTVTPRVVAWGGPGSGSTLKPYQNAVEANEDLEEALEQYDPEATGEEG
ncbi:MAG: hypothetical protein L0H93_17205, partial [Nocardioides sp.]|nr:hypothetical protein [Nocardioides sp.]